MKYAKVCARPGVREAHSLPESARAHDNFEYVAERITVGSGATVTDAFV